MARVPFIVVADRGIVKAYEVRQTPKHGTAARLVMESKLQEAHERYRDKVTDQAGAFPSTGSNGHANAIAERPKMEAEEDTRLFKSGGGKDSGLCRIRHNQIMSDQFSER